MAITDITNAVKIINRYRREKKRIVFTNGCFDLLHRGHIEYLIEAKKLGDFLIIGLNSDTSVKRLKGNSRPYQSEQDRAVLLEALKVVDLIVIFTEDTPLKLICELKPDILVKGGDYEYSSIVGAKEVEEWGGHVEIIPFKEGYGTSQLVNKIRNS